MSLIKTWYSLEETAEKFGLDQDVILKWVEEGIIRAEMSGNKVMRVNIDDVELKIQEVTGI